MTIDIDKVLVDHRQMEHAINGAVSSVIAVFKKHGSWMPEDDPDVAFMRGVACSIACLSDCDSDDAADALTVRARNTFLAMIDAPTYKNTFHVPHHLRWQKDERRSMARQGEWIYYTHNGCVIHSITNLETGKTTDDLDAQLATTETGH